MTAFPGITQDLWALPPRGVTETQIRTGDDMLVQWTYLCEATDCFAMAHSMKSPESAKEQVANHKCPAPPRRGVNPNGKTFIERMWDESDDAMDAYKADVAYRDMYGLNLKFYISGVAECLSFITNGYIRITDDILREMNRRWKMRQGTIPFSPTPGYRFNPPPDFPVRGEPDYSESAIRTGYPDAPGTAIPKKATPRKATKKVASKAAGPSMPSAEVQATIIHMRHKMSARDLATAYNVTPEIIELIWRRAAEPVPAQTALIDPFMLL